MSTPLPEQIASSKPNSYPERDLGGNLNGVNIIAMPLQDKSPSFLTVRPLCYLLTHQDFQVCAKT